VVAAVQLSTSDPWLTSAVGGLDGFAVLAIAFAIARGVMYASAV
jgi:hypothetical protein